MGEAGEVVWEAEAGQQANGAEGVESLCVCIEQNEA